MEVKADCLVGEMIFVETCEVVIPNTSGQRGDVIDVRHFHLGKSQPSIFLRHST